MKKLKTVGEFIAESPLKARRELKRVRAEIMKAAPGAHERIAWGVPYYSLKKFLCALNAYGPQRDKLSLVITPGTAKKFKRELAKLDVSGGTVHFSAEHPIPASLLRKLLVARVAVAK